MIFRAVFWMVWTCHGVPFIWYSMFCFCFCFFVKFRTAVKKNTWMRVISVKYDSYQLWVSGEELVIILKVLFWKLRDISYVQKSFSTITKQQQRHLKDTLQFKILRTWINTKWLKLREKLAIGKNPSIFFEEHWTKTFHLLLYSAFSLKQT